MLDFSCLLEKHSCGLLDVESIYKRINLKHFLKNVLDLDLTHKETITNNIVKIYLIYIKDYINLVGFDIYTEKIDEIYTKTFEDNKFKIREFDALLSGMMFFYFSFFYIIEYPDWEKYINAIVKYNILYLLIDHYLDDLTIDKKEKKETMENLSKIIYYSQDVKIENKQIFEAVKLYKSLVEEYPSCRNSIEKLFEYEIKSVIIQKNSELELDEYYNIAIMKGGYTMLVIASFIENNEHNYYESFLIGAIMQLVDDCLDINEDKINGINTYARKIYEKGNIDCIFYDVIGKTLLIKNNSNIYLVFIFFTYYLATKYPEFYSKKIVNLVNAYNSVPTEFPKFLLSYLENVKIIL